MGRNLACFIENKVVDSFLHSLSKLSTIFPMFF